MHYYACMVDINLIDEWGGIDKKRQMLKDEGVSFNKEKVDLSTTSWKV